jgi:prepilin-type N-terminal cleavage/methylation domain-containing protein
MLTRRSAADEETAGFTLIELLVVSLIIGVLAVSLSLNLCHALRKAREGKTYAHLVSMRTAYQTWKAAEGQTYLFQFPGANATNGNAYALREAPGWYTDNPLPNDGLYVAEDGEGSSKVLDGKYDVYFSKYIGEIMPYAYVSDEEASYGIWKWDDGQAGVLKCATGGFQTNRLSTDPMSEVGSGAIRDFRGWHYRNTDGRIVINNNHLSTEGRRYDLY